MDCLIIGRSYDMALRVAFKHVASVPSTVGEDQAAVGGDGGFRSASLSLGI